MYVSILYQCPFQIPCWMGPQNTKVRLIGRLIKGLLQAEVDIIDEAML